jgi:hypothetical protein
MMLLLLVEFDGFVDFAFVRTKTEPMLSAFPASDLLAACRQPPFLRYSLQISGPLIAVGEAWLHRVDSYQSVEL